MKTLLVFFMFLAVPSAASAEGALDWATGSWGIDVESIPEGLDDKAIDKLRNCQSTPVVITIDQDTMRYKAIHTGEDGFVAKAPVLKSNKLSLTLQYDDETRVMKNGKPQIWHMFFISPDKFYWVLGEGIREDQRDGIIPVARVRCRFAGV